MRILLKEPNAWFPEMLASPMPVAIVAREAVEKWGDLGPLDPGPSAEVQPLRRTLNVARSPAPGFSYPLASPPARPA